MRFVVLLGAVLASLVLADSLDYSRYSLVVMSMGQGPIGAQDAAALKERALGVLKSARYDRDWTVGAYLSSHPLAQRRLERMNLASQRLNTRYLSDGTVSTEYEYPITGVVLGLMLPTTSAPRLLGRTACPCCGQPWPEGEEPPEGVRLVPYESGNTPSYTGIVIDARGLGLRPALFPRVVTENGEEVIGPDFARPEPVAQLGLVGYYFDRTGALTSERIGVSPLMVRALAVTGANSCDLVISRADAARIHGSRSNLELLSRCRVGILAD